MNNQAEMKLYISIHNRERTEGGDTYGRKSVFIHIELNVMGIAVLIKHMYNSNRFSHFESIQYIEHAAGKEVSNIK